MKKRPKSFVKNRLNKIVIYFLILIGLIILTLFIAWLSSLKKENVNYSPEIQENHECDKPICERINAFSRGDFDFEKYERFSLTTIFINDLREIIDD